MTVFDDHPRADGYPLYGEPAFAYLNRSARREASRIRETIELWFRHVQSDHQADLRSRLRSSDDAQHAAAFFELLLHELLLHLGCAVTPHPSPPTGTSRCPDFLARPADSTPFYLEAVVATGEPRERLAARMRLHDFYRTLDAISSPNFFLHLEARGACVTPVPGRRFKARIEAAIAGLDPDAIARQLQSGSVQALPRITLEHEDLVLEIIPFRRVPLREAD